MNIPDHQLVSQVGQGSYGEVWLARNVMGSYRAAKFVFRKTFKEAHPFHREMAGIQRFEPVSRTHPGFVHVLHVGRNESEEFFYYLMEAADDVITGQNINPEKYTPKTLSTEIGRLGKIPVGEAVLLAKQLTAALAHLHEKGLVHRDIKPSNIVFVNGVPKLADIGLVASLDDARSYVGTEGFIPPEGPGSPRADIFSLGKVLYEAATGKDRQKFPELPSNIGVDADADRFLELNEIILKACDPEPARRYQNAREMLLELEHLDSGKSVRQMRRSQAFVRRSRRVLTYGALLLAIAAAIFYTVQRRRSSEKLRERDVVNAELKAAARKIDAGSFLDALPHYVQALRIEGEDPLRAETHRMRISAVLAHSPKLVQMWFLQSAARRAEFSPDGKEILLCDHQIELRDVATGKSVSGRFGPPGLREASFCGDARKIIAASANGFASVFDRNGSELHRFSHPAQVLSVSPAGNGKFLVTACDDGVARVWDITTGDLKQSFAGNGRIWHAILSPDETLLATAGNDGRAILWDCVTGLRVGAEMLHRSPVLRVAFSPDGKRLATACDDGTARIWKSPTGQETAGVMRHGNVLRSIEFSPDGRFILTASHDSKANLWQASLGVPAQQHPEFPNSGRLNSASFDPSGRRLACASADGAVRIWDLAENLPEPTPAPTNSEALHVIAKNALQENRRLAGSYFNAARQRAVVASDGLFRVWDSIDGQPITPPLSYGTNISALVFLEDAKSVLGIEDNGQSGLFWRLESDTHSLEELRQLSGLLSNEWLDLQASLTEMRRIWFHLSVNRPELFQVSAPQIQRWHERQLDAARSEKNPAAILFHLRKLKEIALTQQTGAAP